MKRFFFLISSMVFSVIFLAVYPILAVKAVEARPGEIPGTQRMLNASVQIFLFSKDGKYADRGLGTLVEWGGMKLVITHNHWHFLASLSKAELRDARNNTILELDRQTFKSLILYSDPGTLILQAPKELNGHPASLGDVSGVRTGDRVIIAHQGTSDPDQIALLQTEVRSIDTYKGKPVLRLNTLNGERILPGDSGGGIWFNGQWMGNSWGVFVETEGVFWTRQERQTTIAAQLPVSFLETMNAIQQWDPAAEAGQGSAHPEIEEQ